MMIQIQDLNETPVVRRPVSMRVVRGGQRLDLERFAAALTMLESYVDGMLAATELPAMDPWIDDQVMDARLASL